MPTQSPPADLSRRRAGGPPNIRESPQATATFGPGVYDGIDIAVLTVQRPAEIVNYHSMGTTPGVLAGGLALGAVVALSLTLVTSVRHRRHELALLKTFGCTQRQLASAIASQSTVIAIVGLIIGVPLGLALGRILWDSSPVSFPSSHVRPFQPS